MPPSGPAAKHTSFSGSSHFTTRSFGKAFQSNQTLKPRPPVKVSFIFPETGLLAIFISGRLTYKVRLLYPFSIFFGTYMKSASIIISPYALWNLKGDQRQ